MSVDKKVPQIRFSRFTGEWKDVTLSNVVDIRSGKDYKHLGKGCIPVYGTGGYMLSVDSALSSNENAIGIGRKGTIDKPYILHAPFWTVDTLFYAVPFFSFKLNFLFCLFQKIEWKKYDESTGVPSLSKVAINNVPVCVTNEEEQTQIGSYFQKLDNLINQHQQKHDKLSSIKKAMLEKMFPKQGETIPEIRFKGFGGEWEEKELGEIGFLKNGMNFGKAAMGHGHPFVNLQDVFGKNEVVDSNLGLAYSTENQRKDYGLNAGDVLFVRSSVKPEGVGEAAVVPKNMENTTYSGFIIRFRPSIEMDINFNRFVYSTVRSRKQILASSTSSANSNINQDSLQRIKLALPRKREQAEVGSFFQKLDILINQHQQQITKLNNIKQACLSKMFV